MSVEKHSSSEHRLWLFSCRADFWLASGGASVGLLAAALVVLWHSDRELDGLDFVLSELHLGATYGAIIQQRLWRHRQVDVVLVPLVILALTYAFSMSGQATLLTSIAMYAAVWHRGRQSLGVARFYQRGVGGPVSRAHDLLFRGAIYLPMLAGMVAYTHMAPTEYDGEPYFALTLGAEISSLIGIVAALWVIVYLIRTLWPNRGEWVISPPEKLRAKFIQANRGWFSRMPSPSAAVTCSEHRMRRFCWFSPCIMKSISLLYLRHGPALCGFPRSGQSGHRCGDERSSC